MNYSKIYNRQFSTKSNGYVATDLHEWLKGFTVAEGCFMIIYNKANHLHLDLFLK